MRIRQVLKSKIHRATITDADIEYEGSITIDRDLMDKALLVENEFVHVWNVTNGNRLQTYVMEGRRGSGEMVINGAAAHMMHKGDIVIVSSSVFMPEDEIATHKPVRVFVDAANRIKSIT